MENNVSAGPKMGARLKELRARSGLTQDQVAELMGLTFPDRASQVAALESDRNQNPTINVLSRYLRAVGAQWSDISYLLSKREVPPIPVKQVEKAAETLAANSDLIPEPTFKPEGVPDIGSIDKVINQTQEATQTYQRGMAAPRHGAPRSVEAQEVAVKHYQEYRLQANVIKARVSKSLSETHVTVIDLFGLQSFATKVHSVLRRSAKVKDAAKGEAMRTKGMAESYDYIRQNALDMALAEKVAAVVKEVFENWHAQPPAADC
jgi:transcriptional regulator with XRE-family HTH domain